MTEEFKVGDIVQLRSGGPDMTVLAVPVHPTDKYRCQWFVGTKPQVGYFRPETLKKASKIWERPNWRKDVVDAEEKGESRHA